MASNTLRTIVLKAGEAGIGDGHEELVAAGAIKPGHLVVIGSANTVTVHAAAGGITLRHFAKEDSYQGKTIDDAYASGDPVMVHKAKRGDIINCILTTSQTIIIGDEIMSTGDGTVSKKTAALDIIGKAREAVTTTGTVARIAVEIL